MRTESSLIALVLAGLFLGLSPWLGAQTNGRLEAVLPGNPSVFSRIDFVHVLLEGRKWRSPDLVKFPFTRISNNDASGTNTTSQLVCSNDCVVSTQEAITPLGRMAYETWNLAVGISGTVTSSGMLSSGQSSTSVVAVQVGPFTDMVFIDLTIPIFRPDTSVEIHTSDINWRAGMDRWLDPETGLDAAAGLRMNLDGSGSWPDFLPEGRHQASETATNRVGMECTVNYTLVVDTQAPVLSWTSIPQGTFGAGGILSLGVNASDALGSTVRWWRTDPTAAWIEMGSAQTGLSVTWNNASGSVLVNGLAIPGAGSLQLRAVDQAGNETLREISTGVLAGAFDLTPPRVSVSPSASPVWPASSPVAGRVWFRPGEVSFVADVADEHLASKGYVLVSASGTRLAVDSADFSFLPGNETWSATFSASDRAGNVTRVSWTMVPDAAPPVPAVSPCSTAGQGNLVDSSFPGLVKGSSWWSRLPVLSVGASDTASGENQELRSIRLEKLNGSSWSDVPGLLVSGSTTGFDPGLPDGIYGIFVDLTDRVGNATSASGPAFMFFLDRSPSVLTWKNQLEWLAGNGGMDIRADNLAGSINPSPLVWNPVQASLLISPGTRSSDAPGDAWTSLSANGPGSLVFAGDGSACHISLASVPASLIPDGTFSLKVVFRDGAGNPSTAFFSAGMDRTGPAFIIGEVRSAVAKPGADEELVFETMPSGGIAPASTLEGASGLGPAPFSVVLDGIPIPSGDLAWTWDALSLKGLLRARIPAAARLSEGLHDCQVKAADRVGNTTVSRCQFKVDRSSVGIVLLGTGLQHLQDTPVSTTAEAGRTGANVCLDDVCIDGSFLTRSRTITFSCRDLLLQGGEVLDGTGIARLSLRRIGPGGQAADQDFVLVTGQGLAPGSGISGTASFDRPCSGTLPCQFDPAEGSWNYEISSTDGAGNTSRLEFSLQADRVPPVLTIPAGGFPGKPGASGWLGADGRFLILSSDPPVSGGSAGSWSWGTGDPDSGEPGYYVSTDGDSASFHVGVERMPPGETDGPHRLFVRHQDLAGNTGSLMSQGLQGQAFILDRSPPDRGIITAPAWANQSLAFTFSVHDQSRDFWEGLRNQEGSMGLAFLQAAGLADAPRLQVEARIDGGLVSSGTAGFSALDAREESEACYRIQELLDISLLTEGLHELELMVFDPAGNRAVFSHPFMVDRSPPVISEVMVARPGGVDPGEAGWLPDETIPLTITVSDFWMQDGHLTAGPPESLEWAVGTDPGQPPRSDEVKVIPFGQARYLGNSSWSLVDLEGRDMARTLPGLEKSWLWLRARDRALNCSVAPGPSGRMAAKSGWYRLRILQDLGIGSKPGVRSLSGLPMARLPEDSRPVSSPRFLVSPGNLAGSGFGAYETALYRVVHDANGMETGTGQAMVFDARGVLVDEGVQESPTRMRCIPLTGTSPDTLMTVELENLADNVSNGFYRLDVRMVSTSSKPGPWASYVFRIDTTPPEDMQVRLAQGIPAPDWQSTALVELAWNRPQDRSGIEAYYWRLDPDTPDGDGKFLQALRNGSSLDGWNRSNATNLALNLANTRGQGKWVFSLIARDTADNRLGARARGCFDSQKPSVISGPGIQIIPQEDQESAGLMLGPLSDLAGAQMADQVSGLERVELDFFNLSASGRLERTLVFSLDQDACRAPDEAEARTVIFTPGGQTVGEVPLDRLCAVNDRWIGHVGGLVTDSRYLIKARFRDRAGNHCQSGVEFDLGNVNPDSFMKPPVAFATRIEGYPVKGVQDPAGAGTRAWLDLEPIQGLRIPQDIAAWTAPDWPGETTAILSLDLDVSSLSFDPDTLAADGPREIRAGFERGALARIQGRDFYFKSMEIKEGRGLEILESRIRLPFANLQSAPMPRQEVLEIPVLRTGSALVQVLESDRFKIPEDKGLLLADLACPDKAAWTRFAFSLEGTEEAWFSNSRLVTGSARLGMEGVLSRHSWTLDGRIPAHDIRIGTDGSLESAVIDFPGAVLETSSSRFRIQSGRIDGNVLLVDRSEFLMSFRGKEYAIPVSNFSLDLLEGKFKAFGDLAVKTTSFVLEDGSLVSLGECSLDSQGRLVASGTVSLQDGSSPEALHGLVLGKSGPDWSEDSMVDAFWMNVDGFDLNGLDQVLHPEGILVRTGTIRIQGKVYPFHGLVTDRTRSRILHGATFDTAESGGQYSGGQAGTSGHQWRCNYPLAIHLARGSISGKGIFARVRVALPAFTGRQEVIFDSARIWPERLRVDAESTAPDASWDLSWAGWEVSAAGPSFDGSDLGFRSLSVFWSESDGKRRLIAGNFSWGASGTRSGTSGEILRLRRGALDIEAFGFRFDEAGLSARLECRGSPWLLPDGCQARLGRMGIAPDSSGLEASGPGRLFSLAEPDPESPVRLPVYGWAACMSRAELLRQGNSWLIQSSNWDLMISPENPDQVLPCGRLLLNELGQVVEAEGGTGLAASGPVTIALNQTVNLECHTWQPLPSGLSLDALVSFQVNQADAAPDVLVVRTPGSVLLVKPDLSLESPVLDGPFFFSLQGWNCEAKNLRFDRTGLKAGQFCLLPQVAGLDALDFRGLEFDSNGKVLSPGILASGGVFDYHGWQIDLADGNFGQDGLMLSGRIALPESLGGGGIALDRMKVTSRGEVSSRVSLDHFSLQVDDLSLELESLCWSPEALSVTAAKLTLPEETGGISISLKGLYIGPDGSLGIENLAVSPVKLFGMTFFLDHLGINNGVVEASGAVILPDDLPGELSGMKLALSTLRFTTGGEFLECSVRLDHQFRFEVYPGYSVSARGIGFDWNGHLELCVDQAMLSFPPDIPIGSVAVEGIRFSLEDFSLAFDAFEVTDVDLELDGIEFRLRKGRFSQDGTMVFSGYVKVADTGVEGLRDLTLDIASFQILPGGRIGSIAGSLSVADFPLGQGLSVEKPILSIARSQEGNFSLGLSGALVLGADFPEGIRGSKLVLDEFLVSLAEKRVVSLKAHNTPLSFTMDGGLQFRNISLGIAFATSPGASGDILSSGLITARGTVVFPQDFPDLLRGAELGLQAFSMNLDGSIQVLDASFTLNGTRPLLEGVNIQDARIGFGYQNGKPAFSLGGTICLGNDFPQGIAGSKVAIKTCEIDQYGEFSRLDADLTLGTFRLLDAMTVKNAGIGVTRTSNGSMSFRIHGTLVLPQEFPQGLAGREIAIKDFTLDETGDIKSLDIGLTGIECQLFDELSLRRGSIRFVNEGNDLVLAVAGDLSLPEDLPEGLAGVTLSLQDFRVSVSRGLLNARVALQGDLHFGMFAGIEASINRLCLDPEGMDLGATVTFPPDFPEGLAGTTLVLSRCKLSWKGELMDLAGGLGHMAFTVAGFSCDITNLLVGTQGISLEEAGITLPPGMGEMSGKRLGLKNAGIDTMGNFHGEFMIPDISLDLAGFTLKFIKPSLDIQNSCIAFSQAKLIMPEMLGNMEFAINGVSISATGATIDGLALNLPDFEIPGGLQFKDIGVSVALKGESFSLEGRGSAYLPGGGGFSALVSFTNVSKTYPVGLKRAYFQYTLACPGLAIASTGLYLSAMRGGIAFGPPDEVPAKVRWLFEPDEGIRLQLGITISDASRELVEGRVDTWIDVRNFAWALQGQASFLKGSLNISASILAAISKHGFYAGVDVYIVFIEGHVELYIFQENSRTYVSASGKVAVFIPEKIILDCFPPSRTKLFEVGMEIGTFTNGKEGARGYLNLGLLGTWWAFMDKDGMSFEGIDTYVLKLPAGAASQSVQGHGPLSSRVVAGTMMGEPSPFAAGSWQLESPPHAQNLVVGVECDEGIPWISLTGPDGKVHDKTSPEMETRTEGKLTYAVITAPQAGNWTVKVQGVLDDGSLKVLAFGARQVMEVKIDQPCLDGYFPEAGISLGGTSTLTGGTIELRAVPDDSSHPGWLLGETTVAADGTWKYQASSQGLPDGKYRFRALLSQAGSGISASALSPCVLELCHGAKPLMVENLTASWITPDQVVLDWKDPNGRRCPMAEVWVDEGRGGHWWKIANVPPLVYPVKAESRTLKDGRIMFPGLDFRIRLHDEYGVAQSPSPLVHLDLPVRLKGLGISRLPSGMALAANPGQVESGGSTLVKVRVSCPRKDDPWILGVENLPEGCFMEISPRREAGSGIKALSLHVAPGTLAGPREFVLVLHDPDDPEAVQKLPVPFRVVWPPMSVKSASPGSLSLKEVKEGKTEILIQGEGFRSGLGLALDGQALSMKLRSSGALSFVLPPDTKAGIHKISLRGGDGQIAAIDFAVRKPGWHYTMLNPRPAARAGKTFLIHWQARALDFPLAPPGLQTSGTTPGIESGSQLPSDPVRLGPDLYRGTLALQVSPACPEGSHIIALKGTESLGDDGSPQDGVQVTLVTGPGDTPEIQAMPERNLDPGEAFFIFGSGFGVGPGECLGLDLDGSPWPVVETGDSFVRARVPEDGKTGLLRLAFIRNGARIRESVAWPVFVRSGFLRLSTENRRIELLPGARFQVPIQVDFGGAAPQLSVQVLPDQAGIPGEEKPSGLVPGASLPRVPVQRPGTFMLELDCSRSGPGTWQVIVRAESGTATETLVLDLRIKGGLEILASPCDRICQGSPCSFALRAAERGEGQVPTAGLSWNIAAGSLPPGLQMDASGWIRGTPTDTGTWKFTVVVTDGPGRTAKAGLALRVIPTAWSFVRGSAGGTRSSSGLVSMDPRLLWSVRGLDTPLVISTVSTIFCQASQGIFALDRQDGHRLWSRDEKTDQVFLQGDLLFLLTRDRRLLALDPRTGVVQVERRDVGEICADLDRIACWQKGKILIIHTSSGETQVSPDGGFVAKDCIWHKGELLAARDRELWRLENDRWVLFLSLKDSISSMESDESGLALLLGDQKTMAFMDSPGDGTDLAPRYLRIEQPVTDWTMDSRHLAIRSGENLAVFERKTLEPRGRRQAEGGILAGNCLLSWKLNLLEAWNLYGSKLVWTHEFNHAVASAVVTGQEIQVVLGDGSLHDFGGPLNLEGPVTVLEVKSDSGPGNTGWYHESVKVSIRASDRESRAREIQWKAGAEGWKSRQTEDDESSVVTLDELGDGIHSIACRSIDTQGLAGNMVSLAIKVDTHGPDLAISGLDDHVPGSEWYGSTARIRMAASDSLSGLRLLELKEGEEAWQACVPGFIREYGDGRHHLKFRAQDLAGNLTEKEFWVLVDTCGPAVGVRKLQKGRNSFLELQGTDAWSGVEALSWRIDGGPETLYEGLVPLLPGTHQVEFTGIDRAHNKSPWKSVAVHVATFTAGSDLSPLEISSPPEGAKLMNTGEPIQCSLNQAVTGEIKWYWRLDPAGPWIPSSDGLICIPRLGQDHVLETKVLLLDDAGNQTGELHSSSSLQDPVRLELAGESPAPGSAVNADTWIPLGFSIHDVKNRKLDPAGAVWEYLDDTGGWQRLWIASNGYVRTGRNPGPWHLRVTWDAGKPEDGSPVQGSGTLEYLIQ